MFTLKLTFMQIFIEIGQNLDFDPHLTLFDQSFGGVKGGVW